MFTLLSLALLGLLGLSSGSHYEHGTFRWTVLTGTNVQVEWAQGWRLGTGPCGSGCSTSSIGSFGSTSAGHFTCLSGCSGNLAPVQYTVTAVSIAENWEQGQNSFTYNFPGVGPFVIGYTGCCWRSLNFGSGSSWATQTEMYFGTRSDTNKPNSSPFSTGTPIYRMQYGCTNGFIRIPMLDPEGDSISCRWAAGAECASVCNLIPAATLSNVQTYCRIDVDTTDSNYVSGGWYAGAIQVDDFPKTTITAGTRTFSPSVRLSSVPFQFLVYTPSMNVACSAVPIWASPTPSENHQYSVANGGTLQVTAVAQSSAQSSYTIQTIQVLGVTGGTASSLSLNGKKGSITYTWTPTAAQAGGHSICFQATDAIGKSSWRCVSVAVAVSCSDPGTPSGLTRSVSAGPPFLYGNTVTYNCPTGHEVTTGTKVRTCQMNGLFDGSAPGCTIVSCPALSATSNGAKSGSTYTYNSAVTFTCASGYQPTGSSSRTCQANKQWSGSAFSCPRVSCGSLAAPSNGAKVGNDFQYNGVVSFSCNTGYYMNSGSSSRTCQANKAWSSTHPTCARVNCGVLSSPQNGAMSGTNHWYADTTTFTCNSGYEPASGAASVTCQASGSWSASSLTCKRITCPTLTVPSNGRKTGSSFRFQDQASFSCNTGYEKDTGSFGATCQANRAWSSSQLTCKRITCPTIAPHNNASQTGSSFRFQDYVSWRCNTGYERASGDSNVQCQSSRQWNGTALACKRITCPTLVSHNNATQTGQGFRYLDQVNWACHTGYEPDTGVASVSCLANKKWSGNQRTCKRITCPTLVRHNNATQTGSGNRYLDHVSWNCNTGYEPSAGDHHVQCLSNRAWNGTVLQCKRITCPTLAPHNNATQTGSAFRYLDHVSWTCNTGYEPSGGDHHVQCQSHRAWNGTNLQCKRITCPTLTPHNNATQTGFAYRYLDHISWQCHSGYEPSGGDHHVQCQSNRLWNGTNLQCKRITCPTLAPHNNATQTGQGFRYLDHVSWSCNIGYEPSGGDHHVQCLNSRAWNGTVLQCKRITCPTLGPHNNATQVGFAYRYLDYVSWSCHTGYERDSGDLNVQCQANKAWNGTVLTCKRITCPTLVPHNNATQVGFAYRYLDYVSWSCNTGYEQDTGDFNVQCQANTAWNGSVLACKRITCPTPSYVSNSSMLGSDFKYLGVISYSCDTGYEIKNNGTPTQTCQPNRQWSGKTVFCGRVLCNLTVPADAHIKASTVPQRANHPTPGNVIWAYLDHVEWECDPGYAMRQGNKDQVCWHTRVFNGTTPSCYDIDECLSQPCQNGGQCNNLINSFSCVCANSYTGPFCSQAPTLSPSMQAMVNSNGGSNVGTNTLNQLLSGGGSIPTGLGSGTTNLVAGQSHGVRTSGSVLAAVIGLFLTAFARLV